MKKALFLLLVLPLAISSCCTKNILSECKERYQKELDSCKVLCELELPDLQKGETKEEAVKKCKQRCTVKFSNQAVNCCKSKEFDCRKNCQKERAKECRQTKRECKKDARIIRFQCKNNARIFKRQCLTNCKNNFRGRQRRQCKRNCRATFRNTKRQCNTNFRNTKNQCNSVDCKKTAFDEVCKQECN